MINHLYCKGLSYLLIIAFVLASATTAFARSSGHSSSGTHSYSSPKSHSYSNSSSHSSSHKTYNRGSKTHYNSTSARTYSHRTTAREKYSNHSVTFAKNGHVKRDVSSAVKKDLKEQAGVGTNNKNYVIDHKVALENGGTNDISNLQVLSKSEHTMKTKRDNALRHARSH